MKAINAFHKLSSGAKIPVLGFGTWQAPADETIQGVTLAIDNGFRLIDCARVYQNEAAVGTAMKAAIDAGKVKREDLFVVSKVWNTDHAPDDVRAAAIQSIKDLAVGYLDLYLIHWPVALQSGQGLFPSNGRGGCLQADVPLSATWKAMEALVDDGLVKAIGISNFSVSQVKEIYEGARIKPAVNQIEVHPSLPQLELRALHESLGMVTMAYCPLAAGFGRPMSESLVARPEVIAIAEKYGMTPGQLLLRWGVTRPNVTVLSKSVTPARIAENASTPLEPLPQGALEALEAFGRATPIRSCNPPHFFDTPRPFFVD